MMSQQPTNAPEAVPHHPYEFKVSSTRQPMLWSAVAYALGIVAGTHLSHPASWWIGAGIAFLAAGLYFLDRRQWLATTLTLGAFFLTGSLHIQLRGSTPLLDMTLEPFTDGQTVEMTAHVTREGKIREGAPNEIRQSLDVAAEEIVSGDGRRTRTNCGIRLG